MTAETLRAAMAAPITKPDYRTREGRQAEVLAQFEIDGYLNILWASENHSRLAAAMRLIDAGVIPREKVKDDASSMRSGIAKRDESLPARAARVFDGWLRALFA